MNKEIKNKNSTRRNEGILIEPGRRNNTMGKLNKEDIEELQEFFRELEEKIDEVSIDDKSLGLWLREKWLKSFIRYKYKNIIEGLQNEPDN